MQIKAILTLELFIYFTVTVHGSSLCFNAEILFFFGIAYFLLKEIFRLHVDFKVSHELFDSEIERKDRGNNARHFAHTKLLKSVTSCANNQVRWKTKNKLFTNVNPFKC
jgi:hypothetical protein